jgi:TolA-binding protein
MKHMYLALFVSLCLVSCSKNEESLLNEAREAESGKNFQVAVERYQELVDRFPGSVKAESCLMRLASINSDELHDVERSIAAYKKIYTMFPSSKNAPTSMFLAGFLMCNELHKLDSAKAVYETFLRYYPDHSLAASAKFELTSLGKDPGELIHSENSSAGAASSEDSAKASPQ